MSAREPLILCSKSPWHPPIRREHAWATIAVQHGHGVTFVERPRDVRALRGSGVARWTKSLSGDGEREHVNGVDVRPRTTLVPGHLHQLAAHSNALLLRSILRRISSPDASIVFCWPWDWPAVRAATARRRVFDMADDWGGLMPGASERFGRYYREIADEADEIVVVCPDLRLRFGGRQPALVRNGVFDDVVAQPSQAPEARTMIYIGTLSPRFDADLMAEVMTALPDWRLEIIGGCEYPRSTDAPSRELRRLLAIGERVRWRGPQPRSEALRSLDRASVATVPNRPERSLGQDSMKLYDYAARGRPIVTTRWFDPDVTERPPHLLIADTPQQFAESVLAGSLQSPAQDADRRRWAAENTWSKRWPAWSAAVFA